MTVDATSTGDITRPADGVTVTIDGFEITVPKGTLVVRPCGTARHPDTPVL